MDWLAVSVASLVFGLAVKGWRLWCLYQEVCNDPIDDEDVEATDEMTMIGTRS